MFLDIIYFLNNWQKKGDETVERQLSYPSLQEALSIQWKDLPRKVAKLYFAMRG
jgi:ubiquitin-like 1-activating enzyme E1 A